MIRNKYSPNPTEFLNIFGVLGKLLGTLINKMLEKIIHIIAYVMAGLFYNPKRHRAALGSALYTTIYLGINKVLKETGLLVVKKI